MKKLFKTLTLFILVITLMTFGITAYADEGNVELDTNESSSECTNGCTHDGPCTYDEEGNMTCCGSVSISSPGSCCGSNESPGCSGSCGGSESISSCCGSESVENSGCDGSCGSTSTATSSYSLPFAIPVPDVGYSHDATMWFYNNGSAYNLPREQLNDDGIMLIYDGGGICYAGDCGQLRSWCGASSNACDCGCQNTRPSGAEGCGNPYCWGEYCLGSSDPLCQPNCCGGGSSSGGSSSGGSSGGGSSSTCSNDSSCSCYETNRSCGEDGCSCPGEPTYPCYGGCGYSDEDDCSSSTCGKDGSCSCGCHTHSYSNYGSAISDGSGGHLS